MLEFTKNLNSLLSDQANSLRNDIPFLSEFANSLKNIIPVLSEFAWPPRHGQETCHEDNSETKLLDTSAMILSCHERSAAKASENIRRN